MEEKIMNLEKIMNFVDALTDAQQLQLALYALITFDFGVEVMEHGVVLKDEFNERKIYLTDKQLRIIGWNIRRTTYDILDTVIDVVNEGEKR